MDENKDQPRKVSSCFDGQACAEMMQKIMDEEGIGSLCEEMMRYAMRTRREVKEEPDDAEAGPEKPQGDPAPNQGSNKQEV